MEQFIYHLGEIKYRLYHELYIFNSNAHTEEECLSKIKAIHKYETILEIISLLPHDQKLKFSDIEKEYFSDTPYVHI